jgi:hypothetical protein
MKQRLTILLLFFLSQSLLGQTRYLGFIDKDPIEWVTRFYSDADIEAFYVYTNQYEPIKLRGKLSNGLLTLIEKDGSGKLKASVLFKNYTTGSPHLEGVCKEKGSNKERKISLTQSFDIDYGESIEWKDRELLQDTSLPDKYFKVVVSKKKGEFFARVTGIKIFEKKTNKLIQAFPLECDLLGMHNVSIDDYNFDGKSDFSVFEYSYAGPNTSSIYFLFNPRTGKYFKSSFSGISLEFDHREKRIYERNECCMGRSIMNAEYKVNNNKMILLKKSCLAFDEKTQEYKDVACDEKQE